MILACSFRTEWCIQKYDFTEVSKNIIRYRSENNIVKSIN